MNFLQKFFFEMLLNNETCEQYILDIYLKKVQNGDGLQMVRNIKSFFEIGKDHDLVYNLFFDNIMTQYLLILPEVFLVLLYFGYYF